MRFISALSLALHFFSAPLAEAANCHAPAAVDAKVKSCEDNAYFSEAAVMCVERFEKEVQRVTGRMSKALDKGVQAMNSAQKANLATTGDSYGVSESTLKALIKKGQASRLEVAAYVPMLSYPEDAEEGNPASAPLLKESECYQRNRDVLALVDKDFAQKLAELDRTLAAAKGLHGRTDQHETGLGAGKAETREKVSGAKGQGAGKARYRGHGPQRTGGSDISGSEKLNKKPTTKK